MIAAGARLGLLLTARGCNCLDRGLSGGAISAGPGAGTSVLAGGDAVEIAVPGGAETFAPTTANPALFISEAPRLPFDRRPVASRGLQQTRTQGVQLSGDQIGQAAEQNHKMAQNHLDKPSALRLLRVEGEWLAAAVDS